MRTSHFASIQVVVPEHSYDGGDDYSSLLKTVGMAQSVNIDDNFGSASESVIGTPLPVLAPGYQATNIRMEKATIDGNDFRNLGAFNPLWAHVGDTYANPVNIGEFGAELGLEDTATGGGNSEMYPFMFILSIRNKVSDSYIKSNIDIEDEPVAPDSETPARTNPFGVYVCILNSASLRLTSQNVIIMDQVNAIGRPLSGGWLNDTLKKVYASETNGMLDVVNSVLFGYRG
mgnify:CR=1 FL=1